MVYKKLDLKNRDKFTAGDLGHIESALSEVISSDEGKADKAHKHTITQVTGLDTALTDANWYKGDIPDGVTLSDLPCGMYQIQEDNKALQLGLPPRVGSLEIGQSYNGTKTALAVVNLVNGDSHEVWSNSQNGLTGEWVGWRKSILADSGSAITPLDLRISTSDGVRLFAGDNMIHANLTWIDYSYLLEPGWSGQVFIMRTTHNVIFRMEALTSEAGAPLAFLRAPQGFRPLIHSTNARWGLPTATTPAQLYCGEFDKDGIMSVTELPDAPLYGDISFPANFQWLEAPA